MLEVARPGAAEFPRAVKEILQASLQLRDRRDLNQIGERGLAIARGKLEARLDRILNRKCRCPANQRLANHLQRERDAMFTFLYCPGVKLVSLLRSIGSALPCALGDEAGGRKALYDGDDLDLSAPRLDFLDANDRIRIIVSALDDHIGFYGDDEFERGGFAEDHDRIHCAERRQ